MKKTILIPLLLIYSSVAFAQNDKVNALLEKFPDEPGSYYSISEAIKNPKKVFHLFLSGRGLKDVPKDMMRFQNMVELDLNENDIQNIPDWIGQLTSLKKLSIRSNKLKTLPGFIFKLPNLLELDLWGNSISSFNVENSSVSNLQVLNLSMNRFNNLPPSIIKLTNLKELYLESNQLVLLPIVIFKLKSLQSLSLYHNQISDYEDNLTGNTNVKIINLAYNPISKDSDKIRRLKEQIPHCRIITSFE